MMNPLSLTFAAAILLTLHGPVSAATWLQDFEAAKAQATEEKKDLLVNFTGSDWCGWCIRLKEEVFAQEEFKPATGKFVLVELDFPQDESLITPEIKKQNEELKEKFGVEGFPTIFLMDNRGRPYASTGYQEGGPGPYIDHLNDLQKVRISRDEAFAKADRVVGVERAKLLYAGLSEMEDAIVATHYGELIREVSELDPDDVTGLQAKASKHQALGALAEALMEKANAGDKEGAFALVDAYIEEHQPEPALRQEVLLQKLMVLEPPADNPQAVKVLEEVIAIDAASPIGQQAAEIKAAIQES